MEVTLQPTPAGERHALLDALRGFSLLGVLLANMVSHSGYFFLSKEAMEAFDTAKMDHYAEWIEHFLIDGKFYSLFSMLFGIGFALQMKRANVADINFASRFRRRLLIMFFLGLLHAILLFVGDILTVYAITGMFLILFRNKSDRFILQSAVILTLLPIVQYAIMLGFHLATPPATSPPENDQPFLDQLIEIYRTGSFLEIIQYNLGGLIVGRYPDLLFTGRFFRVLSMFLIGFYISKNLIHIHIEAYRPLIRKVMIWGAAIGIPCNIVLAMMMTSDAYYTLEPIGIIQPIVYAFGVPALCLFYAAAFALLFEKPDWNKRLMVFAPVGQMALTNYLMQSLICAFIFMSYGLQLEARVGPAKLSLIALGIYTAQLIYSPIWLKYFRFGPAEWLWRSLTYRKWQRLRNLSINSNF